MRFLRSATLSGSDFLLQAMQFRGARDRDNPGLLRVQPGERDLGRRCLFPFRDPAEQSLKREGNIVQWLAWEEPRAVGDLVHVETFFARNLGGLIHARTRVPGRLGKATSRTPSMHVDEKSDEAIVLAKRLNKGRQLPAEVVEGRASPKGNSR